MLKLLHIENIAVIERADIEFREGFNVLTGETGAGKSILIDAISAVLGERTSKELIRAGCESATVSALFGDLFAPLTAKLAENGLEPDEEGNILIERRLSLAGKGYIKLNGRPVATAVLKEIAKELLNIHGQHDNQTLLDSDTHCGILDAMASNGKEQAAYYTEFKNLNQIRRELKAGELDEDEKAREIDLLTYQIRELEAARIVPGEMAELKEKLKIAKQYETILEALSKAHAAINGGEEESGAAGRLADAAKALSSLKSEEWDRVAGQVNEARSLLADAAAAIDDFLDSTEYSELDVNEINSRLDMLDRLMLKYGKCEEDCLTFLEQAKERLNAIEMNDQKVAELSEKLDVSTEKLIALGEKLSATRRKTAAVFAGEITKILAYLNMPSVRFEAAVTKGRYTKAGCDQVEFLISANQGEEVKPLKKIASGGELSRVMLAIKSVLLDKDPVGTMIFDEIDSGISGYTAGKVAVQLGKVAKNRQVICVTHLPQIAAKADHHFLIEKEERNGRSFTEVRTLAGEERIEEIARLMAGAEMTENLYNSAKEILDRSKNDDNL